MKNLTVQRWNHLSESINLCIELFERQTLIEHDFDFYFNQCSFGARLPEKKFTFIIYKLS